MHRIFLVVLINLFVAVLMFMIANTTEGIISPIMENASNSMSFMQNASIPYDATVNNFRSFFYIALYIIVAIPITFLIFRLIRTEDEPRPVQPVQRPF